MAHILVQVSIPYFTGLPADVSVNTWSFEVADADESNAAEVGAFLNTFYTELRPWLSPSLDPTQVGIKMYDRADPEPRTPFVDTTFNLGAQTTESPLPEEVAVCFSFRANLASGQPPARRRGRVYLGPLSVNVIQETNRSVVKDTFIDDMIAAYESAWTELTTAGNVHEVWSPTDGVGRTVTYAWMDDAFDTQRRRGPLATSRTSTTGPW